MRLWLWVLLVTGSALAGPLTFDGQRLTVRSGRLELAIEAGAVVGLRDHGGGGALAGDGAGGAAFAVQGATVAVDAATPVAWEAESAVAGTLAYTNVGGSGTIWLRVAVDAAANEVMVTPRGVLPTATDEAPLLTLSVPVVGVTAPRIVLGSGAVYPRDHAPRADCIDRIANGLYSPKMVLLEGEGGMVGLWSMDPRFYPHNVILHHDPAASDLLLETRHWWVDLPAGKDPTALDGPTWRFQAADHWGQVVRRYRENLEAVTGARPLWDHRTLWARRIHAVTTAVPPSAHAAAWYAELARRFAPDKLLCFYWNGSQIITFGDHRYDTSTPTTPAVIDALTGRGFRWIGYHPYLLLHDPKVAADRVEQLRQQGRLPEGWTFSPDYDGAPADFYQTFRPVADAAPLGTAPNWRLHGGAELSRQYLLRNFRDYCAFHHMSGNYMDIMGGEGGRRFPSEKRIQGGLTWRQGEAAAGRYLREQVPELGLMSERQVSWTLAHTFYSWYGGGHIIRADEVLGRPTPAVWPPHVGTNLNHPLRTACWGSYTWTRAGDTCGWVAARVLMGALPEIGMACGYRGEIVADEWDNAVARLYMDEELYPDMPPGVPEAATLAWFRGKDGKRWEFRRQPWGDAWCEMTDGGPRPAIGRYSGVTVAPAPAHIRGWGAADAAGRPLGLHPERVYPYLPGAPPAPPPLMVTSLPPGVYVNAVHATEQYTVIELDRLPDGPARGAVGIALAQTPLRVVTAAADYAAPPASVEMAFPGGVVAVWKEPETDWGRFRNWWPNGNGKLLARGVPDLFHAYNATVLPRTVTLGGEERHVLAVGTGRHRCYTERWVRLEGEAPVLRLAVGYPTRDQYRSLRPRRASLWVNGALAWSAEYTPADEWHPVEVPLAAWTGRTVLLTLSAGELGHRNTASSHLDVPLYFAGAYVDDNPVSLAEPAAALPPPATVVWQDDFGAGALDPAWTVAASPDNIAGAFVRVEDGSLALFGAHYKYQYVHRPLAADLETVSVRARLQVTRTGGAFNWLPGLGLMWANGAFTHVTGGGHRDNAEALVITGYGARTLPLAPRRFRVLDNNLYDFFVRIDILATTVRYYSSLDAATWHLEAEIDRPAKLAGAPAVLVVGRGSAGANPLYSNDAQWNGASVTMYVDDVVIAKPEETP